MLSVCGSWNRPEQLSHGDAPLLQHGSDELSQVQEDVWDVYCHVFSHLQNLLKPDSIRQIFEKNMSILVGPFDTISDYFISVLNFAQKGGLEK